MAEGRGRGAGAERWKQRDNGSEFGGLFCLQPSAFSPQPVSGTDAHMALLDIIVLVVVLIFAAHGLKKGFLAQLLSIVALVVAWWASRPVGKAIAGIISQQAHTSSSAGYVLGTFIALIAIYTALKLIFYIVGESMRHEKGTLGMGNKLFGAVFGGAKAFIVCWVVLCVVAAFPKHFENKTPDLVKLLKGSKMESLVAKWNPVKNSRLGDTINNIEKISRNPNALRRIASEPSVAHLVDVLKRKLAAQVKDEATLQRIRAGDVSAILKVENIKKVLLDPEVLEALTKVDLNDILEKEAREAK